MATSILPIYPSIFNLSIIIIVLYFIRFIMLEYSPTLIVNGYFGIYVLFFLFCYIFTKNVMFSLINGMIFALCRMFYRNIQDSKTLNDYNNIQNRISYLFLLIIQSVILMNYRNINKISKEYYPNLILILILLYLYLLEENVNNNNLMCYD